MKENIAYLFVLLFALVVLYIDFFLSIRLQHLERKLNAEKRKKKRLSEIQRRSYARMRNSVEYRAVVEEFARAVRYISPVSVDYIIKNTTPRDGRDELLLACKMLLAMGED